jgi:hypothetical protein
MKQNVIAVVVLCAVFIGCGTGPKHVSAHRLMRGYELSKTQTLEAYQYCGETNGAVFVRYTRAGLSTGELKSRMLFTETNDLNPSFLERIRSEAIGEQGDAANGSQPIRSEPNRTSSVAGSRR